MKKLVLIALATALALTACEKTDEEKIKEFEANKKWFHHYDGELLRINDTIVKYYGKELIELDGKVNEEELSKIDPTRQLDLFEKSKMNYEMKQLHLKNTDSLFNLCPQYYKDTHEKY